MKGRSQTVVLAVVMFLLGYAMAHSILPRAQAQSAAGGGSVAVVMGLERNGYAPIVVVDSVEQSLLVYEYSYGGRNISLESARTYRFDKLLPEFKNREPSVRQVQDMLQRR